MAICKNNFLRTSLCFALLILQSYCYEKTLRLIVRNQSKMVQRPFSEASSTSAVEKSSKKTAAISHKPPDDFLQKSNKDVPPVSNKMPIGQSQNRPRAKVFKYLSETTRSKGSLTRSSMAKIGLSNNKISHVIGRLVRNSVATDPQLAPPQGNKNSVVSQVNVFDGMEDNKGNSGRTGGGATEDYYVTKHPDYFSKEDSFDESSSSDDGDAGGEDGNSKPHPKPKLEIQYIPVEPIDKYHPTQVRKVFNPTVSGHSHLEKDKKTNYIAVNREPVDNASIVFESIFSSIHDTTTVRGVPIRNLHVRFDNANTAVPQITPRFKISSTHVACSTPQELQTDINLQEKFNEFDSEPNWCSKRTYWNHVFDLRYESLMRDSKWPPLKVILIPTTHVDSIWKRTFDQYHNPTVSKILSNIVKKMHFYTNMSFSWHEVSHLSQWWATTSHKNRISFRQLVTSGRLEITTGGWVEPDEATSHIFGLVHQLIEGHQWLKNSLNYTPKVAWLTNSMTHSPTMTYLLAASEMWYAVMSNLHYSWESFFAEYQHSDLLWLQSWDSDQSAPTSLNDNLEKLGTQRLPKHAVLTHFMQFNSAGFRACGPNKTICSTEFNFAKMNNNLGINTYNVKEKAELLLEQYSKSGTTTPHNVIVAPVGGPFRYDDQTEFDYQYDNYRKLADYINENRKIYKANVVFGTARDYFTTILSKHKTYPTMKGDFMNFADIYSRKPTYWTGYFTTRPMLKILLRRLQSTLRTTEILFSFAVSFNAFERINATRLLKLLYKSRQSVARLSDRNVDSGTLPVAVLKEVYNDILSTTKDCWNIQEICASLLTTKPGLTVSPVYLQKYVYRDGEFISVFRSVVPGDGLMLFNALSQQRTEVVELISMKPNLKILDHKSQTIPLQVDPMWKYTSNNTIKLSKRYYKIVFAVAVPPMTLSYYKVTETYSVEQRAAAVMCSACEADPSSGGWFPFTVQPVQTGDIQLENYKNRLVFDEFTGFLKCILHKATNMERTVVIDFGAFKSSPVDSGMFLFKPDDFQAIQNILRQFKSGARPRITLIVSGSITTEITLIFGTLLQHTVRIYNVPESPLANAIFVESKVDMETSPRNRDLEIYMSIQTNIKNGVTPELYTDNNGFQYTSRFINVTRRIESNMYPITTMAYLQDRRSRLTLITDHAQGVTALQEGQLTVMLDRRILFSDGRGVDEGVADSSSTSHKHFILLEDLDFSEMMANTNTLPSLTATYLSNMHIYPMDMYVIDKNQSKFCYAEFLPLIKQTFPCDVAVLNFRAMLNKDWLRKKFRFPTSALLVLHRQSFTCHIDQEVLVNCNRDSNFFLDKILRNVKGIYRTNLCGTDQGVPVSKVSSNTFPAMELMTVRIKF